ncbi:ATP-dependent DNA helicase [Thermomonas sp. HDW16]|uniref:ATP-dependent DNA helicase n=1 Tax=Thermomonas sp. HDW16 TaxID=2714945 RepID=UPI001408109A|nr:ATP-dependent DNA helicase [Thermomonas sp. HDW16]QIL21370.1 ATP-dependent DNA helicase [Thermomonas sp. HDW16]
MSISRLGLGVRDALSEDAALASRIPGFVARPAQQRLAMAVADAFESRGVLLAEAGTGTGKTFAYLVPALLSGMKTIISTGTRALQDQLYFRDLPRVRDALGTGLKTALLKGRANYLCRYRMEQAKGDPQLFKGTFSSREQVSQFQRVVTWSGRTQFGDMAELDALPEDSPLLPQVTSTADNCLGTECPFWGDCFVVQARQRAQTADIVVVNHHLLLADLALKQEGFGEILPGAQAFVVDEAHQLPELAAQFFGEGLGARPLVELARDAIAECKEVPGALGSVQEPARALEQAARALRAAMDNLPQRGTRWRALDEDGIEPAFVSLADALQAMQQTLEPLREAAPGFDACHLRAKDQLGRLQRWMGLEMVSGTISDSEIVPDTISPAAADTSVHWYELTPRGFRLQRTPLDVSGPLRAHRDSSHAAWVFTSATLAVDGHFRHIAQRLGINECVELIEPSPFDWDRQALCFLPPRLPEPASRDFGYALIETLRPVLEASGGRAFLLFASHRALREAAELLCDAPWPLFVQGSEPRHVLLQKFRDSGNGVLLGTASFREGVDVAGDALSVVVIDKLPFAAPDDPVFEARLDAIRRSGGNPFRDEQLPQAVIALKQGAGRLIRSETDRGVLVLCDPRLTQKTYGRVFLDSLPPIPKTRELADVQRFFDPARTAQ